MFMEVVGDENGDVSMVVFPREKNGVVIFEFQLTPCSTNFMFSGNYMKNDSFIVIFHDYGIFHGVLIATMKESKAFPM
jgi:hypothetical protein